MQTFRELFFQTEDEKPSISEKIATGIVHGLINGNFSDPETQAVLIDLEAYSSGSKPDKEWSATSDGLRYIENLKSHT